MHVSPSHHRFACVHNHNSHSYLTLAGHLCSMQSQIHKCPNRGVPAVAACMCCCEQARLEAASASSRATPDMADLQAKQASIEAKMPA